MPGRARKRAAAEAPACSSARPASRTQSSAPRRPRVSQTRFRRQATLTQYDRGTPFAALSVEDSEDEFDEPHPKKRSRRSILPGKTDSQNTLTQIGWMSTIPPSDSDEDEEGSASSGTEKLGGDSIPDAEGEEDAAVSASDKEFNGFSDGDAGHDGQEAMQTASDPCEEMNVCKEQKEQAQPESLTGSEQHHGRAATGEQIPQTPRKYRLLEVPSSQSPPVTPLSAIHTHERRRLFRSPLQSLSTNPQSPSDSPSRVQSAAASVSRSTRKAVTFKDQCLSSANNRHPKSPVSSGIADSEDGYSDEADEDEHEHVVNAVAGIDIGRETQAYIRRIDFQCASATATATAATAEPGPSQQSTQDEDHTPLPHGSADRSFKFNETAHHHRLPAQPGHPAPASPLARPAAYSSPSTTPCAPTIKQEEPETQHPGPRAPDTHHLPHLSSPRPYIKPDAADAAPPSPPHPPVSSSPLPETYDSHAAAAADDDEALFPSSQPTQLHLKQILLQPSTQDEDERDRVPDSQGGAGQPGEQEQQQSGGDAGRGVGVDAERDVGMAEAPARRGRVEGLVTATQMMAEGSGVGEEFSLPPPPPWSQSQSQSQVRTQTQETVDEV